LTFDPPPDEYGDFAGDGLAGGGDDFGGDDLEDPPNRPLRPPPPLPVDFEGEE
jgi:hypothetical protein